MKCFRHGGDNGFDSILQFQFLNSQKPILVLDTPGIQVISTGCGSGKTTAIKDLIFQYSSEGILYAAGTIKECNEMYDWLMENAVGKLDFTGSLLSIEDIISIHSEPRYDETGKVNNGVDLDLWNNNPKKLRDKKIIICTHHKLFHEYPDLLIGYNLNISPIVTDTMNEYEKVNYVIPGAKQLNPRRYVLIDEFPRCGVLKKRYIKSDLYQLGLSAVNSYYNWQTNKVEYREQITKYRDFNAMVFKYDSITASNPRYKITESSSEPAEFRKRMILSDLHMNYDKYINSDEDEIKVSCNILNLRNSYSRIFLFEGTGDLLYSGTSNNVRLTDVYPKYNSRISYIRLNRFIERTNTIETEDDKCKILSKLDESIDELITTVFNRSDVRKVLIVTWKNLKSDDSNDDKNLFSISINENFSLTEYITNKLTGRIGDKEFSIIHYQSGLDRATNEFREFDSIVFLGKFQIPDSAVTEINEDLGSDCTPRRYLLHQLVQAVCRTRIRNHKMEDINIFYTGDWNIGVINNLMSYLGGSLKDRHDINIGSLVLKNKWKSAIEKLVQYEPELFNAIKNKLDYELSIELDDLYELIPMSRKAVSKYDSLSKYLKELGINLVISTCSNNKGYKS